MLGLGGQMAGAARPARLGWNGLRVTMLVGASSGAASGAGASGYAYMTGPGPHIVEGFVGNALAGGLGGGLMGGASPLLDTGWRAASPMSPDTVSWSTRQFSPGMVESWREILRRSPSRRG